MSYASQLTDEINAVLSRLAVDGVEWRAAFVTQEVCRAHADGLANEDDAVFWEHCGYAETRREVTRCINSRAGDTPTPRTDEQLILPGYRHLQNYYVVERDGDRIGVRVDHLSDDELMAKAALYRANGRANFAHANELVSYKESREAEEAA